MRQAFDVQIEKMFDLIDRQLQELARTNGNERVVSSILAHFQEGLLIFVSELPSSLWWSGKLSIRTRTIRA